MSGCHTSDKDYNVNARDQLESNFNESSLGLSEVASNDSDDVPSKTEAIRSLWSTSYFVDSINCNSDRMIKRNFAHNSRVVESNNQQYLVGENGVDGIDFFILPDTDIIYANPINGTVNIHLGYDFISNHTLMVKDVTPEFGSGSSYDVNIIVSGNNRIEHYDNELKASKNAMYTITTSGGAVTLRYARLNSSGNSSGNSSPIWLIQNQFNGNQRLLGHSKIAFRVADNHIKEQIINTK